jgi:hypothetical protein
MDSMVIADGLAVNFSSGFSNDLSDLDAIKAWNLDEVLGTSLKGKVVSVESRNLPGNWDVIPLHTSQYRATNYKFRIQKNELSPYTIMLVDHFTEKTITLTDGETEYSFYVNSNDAASIAVNRFEIIATKDAVVETGYLNITNHSENNISVGPNPTSGIVVINNLPFGCNNVEIRISNLLGKQVTYVNSEVKNGTAQLNFENYLPAGTYLLNINLGDHSINRKIQIQ